MFVWCVSKNRPVFPSLRPERGSSAFAGIYGAGNYTASVQIALRDTEAFKINGVKLSGLGEDIGWWYNFQEYIVYNDMVPYPDPLSDSWSPEPGGLFNCRSASEQRPLEVKANFTQSVWLSFQIGREAAAGKRTVKVVIGTDKGEFTAAVLLDIIPVSVPETKDMFFSVEHFIGGFSGYDTEPWSDEWWSMWEEYARSLELLGNNILNVNPLGYLVHSGSKRVSEDEWDFVWDDFDRYTGIYLSRGAKAIACSSLIASVYGKTMSGIGYSGIESYTVFTEDCEKWVKAFYTALFRHCREKGVTLYMRLEDEPHQKEYWLWARSRVREYMPGVKCGEPIDTHEIGMELAGECDQLIPRTNVYTQGKDYYVSRQAKGDECWVYTCCFPEESWFMNRFIDQPFTYSKLLIWGCHALDITGYLHWGYTYWSDTSLYGTGADARFKGDGFLLYPDPEHKSFKYSTRFFAMRDGIREYELLRRCGDEARKITGSVVRGFDDFDSSPAVLDDAERRIFALVCACEQK